MNRTASDGGFKVLATVHIQDDEAPIQPSIILDCSLAHLSRGQPVLPQGGMVVKNVKLFCRISERESTEIA